MKTQRVQLTLAFLCLSLYTNLSAQTYVGKQEVIQVPTADWGAPANALLSLPDDYSSTSQSYPLIIFLHGWGEAGTDINKLITTALPKRIADGFKPVAINPADGKLYKFIVVSPQAPDFSFQYGHIKYILADVLKRYRVDLSRLYITGLSAGGYGTWTCMSDDVDFCKKVAAIAPISSMAVDGDRPDKINNATKYGVAVWSICGKADDKWPIAVDYTDRLNAVNPVIKAKLTGLEGVGHSAWNQGYDPSWKIDNMNLYEWLLQYKRVGGTTNTNSNLTPVARPGNGVIITLPANTVTLDGSGSTDPDGRIIAYYWSKISGPSQATIANANTAKPTVSNMVEGVYVFELSVTDDKNAVGKATIQVTVQASANKAPVAYAGKDVTLRLPSNSTVLNADGSNDPDGQITGGKWTKISGPSQYTLTNEQTGTPTLSNLVAGTYLVELYVYDNKGASARDTVQVNVLQASAAYSSYSVGSCKGRKIYIVKGTDNGKYIGGKSYPVYPGDTLVLKASSNPYSYLSLENIYGSATCPVVIINEGGRVQIGAMAATNCRYLKFTGSGSADKYGFFFSSANGSGTAYSISGRSSDIEMERSEVYHETYMAWVKHEADCVDSLQYPNWTLDNISFHDNKGSNIAQDALYFGSTSPNGMRAINCNGTSKSPIPMRLSNIRIYNNIIDSVGRTAIQLSGADKGNNEIYNNRITRVGYELNQSQGSGIISGGDTRVYIHDNYIRQTFQNGIFILGAGLNRVENNNVDSSGYLGKVFNSAGQPAGILIDTRATVPSTNTLISIKNNVLGKNAVSKGEHIIALKSYNTYDPGNQICGNITQSGSAAIIYVAPGINWTNCVGSSVVNSAIPVAVESLTAEREVQLYPNPAIDVVQLKFASSATGAMKVKIYDVLGKLATSLEIDKQGSIYEKTINVSALRTGQYFLKLELGNGDIRTQKFLKR